jgi:hypothetical protein
MITLHCPACIDRGVTQSLESSPCSGLTPGELTIVKQEPVTVSPAEVSILRRLGLIQDIIWLMYSKHNTQAPATLVQALTLSVKEAHALKGLPGLLEEIEQAPPEGTVQ